MSIGILQTIEYPTAGPWRAARVLAPAWRDVESAIRQMDGHSFPQVELFLDSDPTKGDASNFELLGGKIGFVVTARVGGGEFYYRNAAEPSKEVAVWTSDQGFSCLGFMVCPDLERVIGAARHFYETGQLLENFPWSPKFA